MPQIARPRKQPTKLQIAHPRRSRGYDSWRIDGGSATIPLQIAQLVERGIVVNTPLINNPPQVTGSNPVLEIAARHFGPLAQLVRAFGC